MNNGVLSYVNKFYSYWNVINTSISSTNTDIFFYVTDTWTTPVRRLETSTNFKPKLYINWDVTLTWSIDFKYQLFLQNHELYVDWTEDLYFSRVHWWWWWKILSSNWNWDWEKLKIWTVRSTFETNIEDTEIVWTNNWMTGRNLLVKWALRNTSTFNTLTFTWTTTMYANTILNWDVLVSSWATLNKYYTSTYYTLTINWDLENNWTIWWNSNTYASYWYIHAKWDILNNWVLSYASKLYLYWKIDNLNWNLSVNTYLKWNQIDDYTNYILSITWEDDIYLSTTQYLLPTSIKENWTNLYWKVKWDWIIFDSDWTDAKCINVSWCVTDIWEDTLSNPINLTQKVESSFINVRNIEVWEQIWKYQSGSWIILSAEIPNDTSELRRLVFEIYEIWGGNPIQIKYTDYLSPQVVEYIVPYLWVWDYYWRVRIENNNYNISEWVEFEDNYWESDYSLFEWFEPYPYGYDFYNRSIDINILTWWIEEVRNWSWELIDMNIIPWTRWEIFEAAFDTSIFFGNEYALMYAFENMWMDKDILWQGWNCYWMAISSVMQLKKDDYMQNNFLNFYNKVWTWTVWEKLDSPSTNINWSWDIFNETLEAISAFQVTQYSWYHQNLFSSWTMEPEQVLNTLNQTPNNTYILFFWWIDNNWDEVWHAVIPYRVEWNKIYIWDNNNPYSDTISNNDIFLPYKQYFEIIDNNDWTFSFKNEEYEYSEWKTKRWTDFTEIWLINIEDIYHWGEKVDPLWFNYDWVVYTLSWESDIYVIDSKWRKSWFEKGKTFEDIPWIKVIKPLNNLWKNSFKQIYISNKMDLTIKVKGNKKENYDLMIAWWNYFTKISDIEITKWEEDTFISEKEYIDIDFDDNKKWSYSLTMSDLSKSNIWNINISTLKSSVVKHKYTIDWEWVKNNKENSFILEIYNKNNWKYELIKDLKPIKTKWTFYKLEKEINWFTKENKDN